MRAWIETDNYIPWFELDPVALRVRAWIETDLMAQIFFEKLSPSA